MRSRKRSVWKTARDVAKVSFSSQHGRKIMIGGRAYGKVYVGRLYFRDGSVKRVAIKRFTRRMRDDKRARSYQRVINDLAKAGVRIPKMGMVKLPDGEWVQVSQLFGSSKKGSKIVGHSRFVLGSRENCEEATVELVKIANAGYFIDTDVLEPFKSKPGVIAIDLDNLVLMGKTTLKRRASTVVLILRVMGTHNKVSFSHLIELAIRTASPELKPFLVKAIGSK